MNDKATNPMMNADDYENMAVQKSNNAKRVAAGAALFVGGAAVASAAAYATTADEIVDPANESELTADDLMQGGNVGVGYQPEVHSESSERVVYVEKDRDQHQEQESEENAEVTWDERTVVYDENGEVIGSTESGTVDGHKFSMVDMDNDNKADIVGIDINDNGTYEENEIVRFNNSDGPAMGHETAKVTEWHYMKDENNPYSEEDYPAVPEDNNDEIIHNNFEDEKTGETYNDDYADNNNDYNPRANLDYGTNDYLAENDRYEENDDDEADFSDCYAEAETTDDSYTQMGGEEDLIG